MAGKAKTRVKLAAAGRNVVATFPIERLRAILPSLPEGDERKLLEEALAKADERQVAQKREERKSRLLSIESVIPFGWMLTGDASTLAYGAIREGDFRHEADGSWTFGPPGAFDREDDGVEVLRDAAQGGVMSEEHGVFRLEAPTRDRHEAIDAAIRLEADWRASLPARLAKPRMLLDGGCFRLGGKGMHRTEWYGYMREEDLADLPEGARIASPRGFYRPGFNWHVEDIVHGGEDRPVACVYRCDAILRPRHTYDETGGYHSFTLDHRWMAGAREYDPRYDGRWTPAATDGPYDCLLGSVWVALHNDFAGRVPGGVQLVTGRNTGTIEYPGNDRFPLASRADAEAVAWNYAIALELVEGDRKPEPPTIAAPDFEVIDMAQAA